MKIYDIHEILENLQTVKAIITKTLLFKYIEKFTTKN